MPALLCNVRVHKDYYNDVEGFDPNFTVRRAPNGTWLAIEHDDCRIVAIADTQQEADDAIKAVLAYEQSSD